MHLLTLFIAASLGVTGGSLFADEKMEADLVKIGELNEAYVTAFNAQDVQKLAPLFTDDAEFTLLTGDMLQGREPVLGGHLSFFKNNPSAKVSGKQQTHRFVRTNVVLATGIWKVENGPQEYASTGVWSTVVVKQRGQWKYTAMRLMVPATASSE